MRSARYAIWVFGGILALIAGFRPYIDAIIAAAVFKIIPSAAEIGTIEDTSTASTALLLTATVVMFLGFFVLFRDKAPLGYIRPDSHIKEPSYRERRSAFVAVLKSHLVRVDDELRWHHRHFVALRAEVDVRNSERNLRRTADLVEAIKLSSDADIFVVVGVPGAGKSVALRKCCMDLLDAQRNNERIPIYVNLKEWISNRGWSTDEPPSDAEFAEFVRVNVRDRLSDQARGFFQEHFERLANAGEIFFMFDSFDEIPGILDADETSKLLDSVSAVVVRYLRGQANGRGVISSRYYRRPRLGQERHVQLDVRPFSERQIAQVITQGASRAVDLKRLLLKDRSDLGVLARNPFTLSLILLYWENHQEPPPNQSELFAAYIERSLREAEENASVVELDSAALRQAMSDISWAMFESDRRGLEMTVRELRHALERDDMDAVVDALVAARLARKAPRTQAVSFVHRRFNEYFLVTRWLSGERKAPLDAIPTDSRYRDALVLYTEVASEQNAEMLAEYCWKEISATPLAANIDIRKSMRPIYSLRFLSEAFRSRLDALSSFQAKLSERVESILTGTRDILTRKIAVEAVGIISPSAVEPVLSKALSIDNRWITDTSFLACRYLPALPLSIESALFRNITNRGQSWILVPDKEFNFTLSIADAFQGLRRRFIAARLELWLRLAGGFASIIFLEAILGFLGVSTFIACLIFVTIITLSLKGTEVSNVLQAMQAVNWLIPNDVDLKEILITSIQAVPFVVFISTVIYGSYGGFDAFSENGYGYYPFLVFAFYVPIFSIMLSSMDGRLIDFIRKSLSTDSIKKVIYRIAFVLAGGAITAVIAKVIAEVKEYMDMFVKFVFLPLVAIYIAIVVVKQIRINVTEWWSDRGNLSAATIRFNPSRGVIAADFASFKTELARRRYVQWLERESTAAAHRTVLADLMGNPWPQLQRPNIRDGESSTALAQLDARWIGIDV